MPGPSSSTLHFLKIRKVAAVVIAGALDLLGKLPAMIKFKNTSKQASKQASKKEGKDRKYKNN